MVRAAGALLIVSAPLLLSFSQYAAFCRQERLLAAFSQMLGALRAQICCNRMALPRIAREMERRGALPLRTFWGEIAEGLAEQETSFDVLWRDALAHLALSPPASEILVSVPAALRFYNTEEIAAALENTARRLEEHRAAVRCAFRKNFKMYAGARLSAALFLLILLV